jgi:hypothetical protein
LSYDPFEDILREGASHVAIQEVKEEISVDYFWLEASSKIGNLRHGETSLWLNVEFLIMHIVGSLSRAIGRMALKRIVHNEGLHY